MFGANEFCLTSITSKQPVFQSPARGDSPRFQETPSSSLQHDVKNACPLHALATDLLKLDDERGVAGVTARAAGIVGRKVRVALEVELGRQGSETGPGGKTAREKRNALLILRESACYPARSAPCRSTGASTD
jgi:hypothetical protein